MTEWQHVSLETADGLLTLTLRRPPLNVLNIALLEELEAALIEAAGYQEARLLLLRGQGERCFCAGVDVADHTRARVVPMLTLFHRLVRRLHEFPVPTLAALNGAALGGGLELVLACDLCVAVEDARLAQPEIQLGVFAPVAAVLLPRRLPVALAHEMLLGGASLTAQQALAHGLINRVFGRAEFESALAEFIAPYLRLSAAAQRHNKAALCAARDLPLAQALPRLEAQYLEELMATRDAEEGLAAYLEKRAPQWRHE